MNYDAKATIRLNGNGNDDGTAEHGLAFGRADRWANVGQLAAGLAHEMNTPLGSISAHAEETLDLLNQLQTRDIPSERLDEIRARQLAIMRQANRCSRIATRLLQFAQPTRAAGGSCEPQLVVDAVLALLGPSARALNVHLDPFVEQPLPEAAIGASELEQVLVNLIQNSLDACHPGDRINIEVAQHDDHLQFVVTDTGCGIPAHLLNRVFDPFFTTKPVGKGTGLGLSVCQGIVRSVGGSIEIESGAGQGTRVTVVLPVAGAAAELADHDSSAP